MYNWLIPALNIFSEMQEQSRVPHALLICAADGLGGSDLAREISRRYLCQENHADNCTCHSCSMLKAGTHSDFLELSRGDGSSIGIDEVRKGTQILEKTPANNHGKVLYINEAETMTIAAQNALLKTLEEPPESSLLILSSGNVRSLLPTIMSRTMRIPVVIPPLKEMNDFIVNATGKNQDYRLEIFISGNSPLKALSFVNDGIGDKFREGAELLNRVFLGQALESDLADFLVDSLSESEYIYSFLYTVIRDAMVIENGGHKELLCLLGAYPDLVNKIAEIDVDSLKEAQGRLIALKKVPGMKISLIQRLQMISWISILVGRS